jgi:oligopeptidase B
VLVGYGAYGESVNLGYDPTWRPLLDRGFLLAFAHTRGGGELGKGWYHAGRLGGKVRAVEDFCACAKALREWHPSFSPPQQLGSDDDGTGHVSSLTAKAFSAGGVIVGAAANAHPELFDKVVLTNAFCDVSATLMNASLFLTSHEWEEYGNPVLDPKVLSLVNSYCPVSSIPSSTTKITNYPDMLLIGTLDDGNVPYWNAVIMANKLRDSGVSRDRALLHVEDGGGHELSGERRIHVAAMELAFILGDRDCGICPTIP